jgi:hypothetical protein
MISFIPIKMLTFQLFGKSPVSTIGAKKILDEEESKQVFRDSARGIEGYPL